MKIFALISAVCAFGAVAGAVAGVDAKKLRLVDRNIVDDLPFVSHDNDAAPNRKLSSSPEDNFCPESSSESESEPEWCTEYGISECSPEDQAGRCSLYANCKPQDTPSGSACGPGFPSGVVPVCPTTAECQEALATVCPKNLKTPCSASGIGDFCEFFSSGETCMSDCTDFVRSCCPRAPFETKRGRTERGCVIREDECDAPGGICSQAFDACSNFGSLDDCEVDQCYLLEERACALCSCQCAYTTRRYRNLQHRRELASTEGSQALLGGINPDDPELRDLRNTLSKEEIEHIFANYLFQDIDSSGKPYTKQKLLTPDDCEVLIKHLKDNKYRSDQEFNGNVYGAKLYLTVGDLVGLLGKDKTQDVLNSAYEAAGEVRPVLKIFLNELKNDGVNQEDYHTDWRSERQESTTFMVALNKNESLISGGEVHYLSKEDGITVVERDQGMAYAQSSRIFHGVPSFEGTRSTLFIILVKDMGLNPGRRNLVEGTGLE